MTRREPPGVAILAARITGSDYRVVADERDATILAECVKARARFAGPRVGDFIEYVDGEVGRLTHGYPDAFQTTVRGGKFGYGSHYLTTCGRISYSGALDPSIPRARIVDTGEERLGAVWFFHHDFPQANGAVYAEIPCRVYRELPET